MSSPIVAGSSVRYGCRKQVPVRAGQGKMLLSTHHFPHARLQRAPRIGIRLAPSADKETEALGSRNRPKVAGLESEPSSDPEPLTPACSPSGGMEVRRQVASEKRVPCEKTATEQEPHREDGEDGEDREDGDALGTPGPEGSCCSHPPAKEEPEIQVFKDAGSIF